MIEADVVTDNTLQTTEVNNTTPGCEQTHPTASDEPDEPGEPGDPDVVTDNTLQTAEVNNITPSCEQTQHPGNAENTNEGTTQRSTNDQEHVHNEPSEDNTYSIDIFSVKSAKNRVYYQS